MTTHENTRSRRSDILAHHRSSQRAAISTPQQLPARWPSGHGYRTKAQRAERDNAAERSNREILMSYVRSECALSQSPRTTALMRMLVSESLSDRSFAIRMYHEVRRPFIDELSSLFAAWAAAGNALIEDPEATAQLFISIISGDTVLGRLFGVDEEFLDEETILWRLQPFFRHFEIS